LSAVGSAVELFEPRDVVDGGDEDDLVPGAQAHVVLGVHGRLPVRLVHDDVDVELLLDLADVAVLEAGARRDREADDVELLAADLEGLEDVAAGRGGDEGRGRRRGGGNRGEPHGGGDLGGQGVVKKAKDDL